METLKVFKMEENNGKQNPKNSYTKNIKNILFAVMTVNLYVSVIRLVSLLKHT